MKAGTVCRSSTSKGHPKTGMKDASIRRKFRQGPAGWTGIGWNFLEREEVTNGVSFHVEDILVEWLKNARQQRPLACDFSGRSLGEPSFLFFGWHESPRFFRPFQGLSSTPVDLCTLDYHLIKYTRVLINILGGTLSPDNN